MKSTKISAEEHLRRSVERLDRTIEELPKKFSNDLDPGRSLFFSFLKGIASGLGVLVSVAIIVPFIISSLRSINWVPLIGKFVSEIAVQMEQAQRVRQ